MGPCLVSMVIDAPVACVLIHCRDEVSMHQTVIFMVVYGELHNIDILVIIIKMLVYSLIVEHINGAKYLLNAAQIPSDQASYACM